jgi:uncharacterized protein YdeI (YjbR/CyaY-like superfamily)
MAGKMPEVTEDIISNLADIDQAVALMNALSINSDEVEELADAQHELRRYLAREKKAKADGRREAGKPGIRNDVYKITAANVSHGGRGTYVVRRG